MMSWALPFLFDNPWPFVIAALGFAALNLLDWRYGFFSAMASSDERNLVPAVVDLAAMRSAVGRMGGDVTRINPLVPADLVIDHSVQVDQFGTMRSFFFNVEMEYKRNSERYALLRWAQQSFQNSLRDQPAPQRLHSCQ